MDPNEALRKLRELADDVTQLYGRDAYSTSESAMELVEAFEGLDQWLKQGGFLPIDWKKPHMPEEYGG